jgi:long-chain acyl-CoA synthetase
MVTHLYMINGVSIYYAESMEVIADNLREVKPQIFTTVPRLLEKVYDKIVAKGHDLEGVKKNLFFWALDLGLKFDTQKNQGFFYNTQLTLANKLIFNKWREALGGNLRCIVSGGGALQPRLARVFWAAGIRVMTKSASVMKGYYNKPDLTAQEFDEEGWFHTGDIGELVNGKFLKITDRKKEMFKTSGGKYIAPQVIEGKLKEDPLIEQAMVVGADQKFPSALIIPSFADLKAWCKRNGIPADAPNEELIKNPKVVEHYHNLVKKCNQSFAQWEQVKKTVLLPDLWTVESGEMTPTMKVKRKIIAEKNKSVIENLYS